MVYPAYSRQNYVRHRWEGNGKTTNRAPHMLSYNIVIARYGRGWWAYLNAFGQTKFA